MLSRNNLIQAYENMMYKYGECDIWDDDIQPKLSEMSYKEIYQQYKKDEEYYGHLEKCGGTFTDGSWKL